MKSSRGDLAAEKQKWAMRYFDFTDNPIKDWVSDVLEEDVNTIFDDYRDSSDVLSVESKDKFYSVYVTHKPENVNHFPLKYEQVIKQKKLHKAVSMMLEAVYTVYQPVIKTMSSMGHRMEHVHPKFDDVEMTFTLTAINTLEFERKNRLNRVLQIQSQLEKIKNETGEEIEELRRQLNELKPQAIAFHNEITNAAIAECQETVNSINKVLKNKPKLYVCLDVNSNQTIDKEERYKRMPQFGLKYQDPDEETYIDKLKRGD